MQLQTTSANPIPILKLPRRRQDHLKLLVMLPMSEKNPHEPQIMLETGQPLHLLQLLGLVLLPGSGAANSQPDPTGASNRRGVLHQLELAVEKLLLILEFLAMKDDVSILGHLGKLCDVESCCRAIWSCFRLWMITSLPQEHHSLQREENSALVAPYPQYWAPTCQVVLHAQHTLLARRTWRRGVGLHVCMYVFESSQCRWRLCVCWYATLCNAPLHRGQKRKIEKKMRLWTSVLELG